MDPGEYERMYQLEDLHWWFVSRRRLARALIERWMEPKPRLCLLDVGCGTGGNLAFLGQENSGTGVDLSPLALSLARRRDQARLVQASSLALPYPDQAFDLVTLFDVLYHRWITDDEQALREVYRVLRPSGWLLLTDSALPGLWSAHDEIFYARQRYTLAAMRENLYQAGFRRGVFSYTNATLLPMVVATRLLMRWFPTLGAFDLHPLPHWLNRLFINIRNLERVWLDWGGRFPVGSSLICLTQKPQSNTGFQTKIQPGYVTMADDK